MIKLNSIQTDFVCQGQEVLKRCSSSDCAPFILYYYPPKRNDFDLKPVVILCRPYLIGG